MPAILQTKTKMTIKNLEVKLSLEFVKKLNVNNTKTLELLKTTSHTADILMGCVLITGIVVLTIRILIKVTKVTKFHINRTTDDKPTNDRNEWGHSILKAEELPPKELATTICEGLHAHPLGQHSATEVLGVPRAYVAPAQHKSADCPISVRISEPASAAKIKAAQHRRRQHRWVGKVW